MKVTITPSTKTDETFFRQLNARYMQKKFQFLPTEQVVKIAEIQYQAKLLSYKIDWTNAITYLVSADQIAIGKIILAEQSSNIHIIDLLLSDEFQNQGLGHKLLNIIAEKASHAGYSEITLSVTCDNPAKNLYQKLGYNVISQNESHLNMQKSLPPI